MYFLDTNSLYWYEGRENIGKTLDSKMDCDSLRSFLDNRSDKSLASSAYVETMVKYRDKPEYAGWIKDFLLKKNLELFNSVQYQTLSTKQVSYITNLRY